MHPSLAALAGKPADDADTAQTKRKVLLALGITAGICALAFLASLVSDYAAPVDAQLQQQGFPLDALRAMAKQPESVEAFFTEVEPSAGVDHRLDEAHLDRILGSG